MNVPLLSGFLAGVFHVVSGPDHLTAVAPLAATAQRSPWRAGLHWGVGHGSGVALVGVLLLLGRGALPIEKLSNWGEVLVGFTLWGVGLWSLRTAFSKRLHLHIHRHGTSEHAHLHFHDQKTSHPKEVATPHRHRHAAFAIGTLHGLAGSSHFFGVLPALALPSTADAVGYLVAFGVGTVAGMAGFAQAMRLACDAAMHRGLLPYRVMMASLSLAAIGTGTYWLVSFAGNS